MKNLFSRKKETQKELITALEPSMEPAIEAQPKVEEPAKKAEKPKKKLFSKQKNGGKVITSSLGLKSESHLVKMLKSSPLFVHAAVPAIILAAIGSSYLAIDQVTGLVSATTNKVAASDGSKVVNMRKVPLTGQEAEQYAKIIESLTTNVKVAVNAKGEISIKAKMDDYQEWLYAVSIFQSHTKGVLWESQKIALGKDASGGAEAIVVGFKQNFTLTGN